MDGVRAIIFPLSSSQKRTFYLILLYFVFCTLFHSGIFGTFIIFVFFLFSFELVLFMMFENMFQDEGKKECGKYSIEEEKHIKYLFVIYWLYVFSNNIVAQPPWKQATTKKNSFECRTIRDWFVILFFFLSQRVKAIW